MKICRICGIEKELKEFPFRKDSKVHRTDCIKCNSKARQERKLRPKVEKAIEALPEGFKRCNLFCKQIKPLSEFFFRKDSKVYRNNCKDCHRIRTKSSPNYRMGVNNRHAKRIQTDSKYKFIRNLRRRFLDIFKAGKAKDQKVLKYLGCSVEYAMKHIESQFAEGMSWENWGMHGWHIDHIIPVNTIKNEADELQIKIVFHYTNLQPLWAKENLSKGSKILKQIEE